MSLLRSTLVCCLLATNFACSRGTVLPVASAGEQKSAIAIEVPRTHTGEPYLLESNARRTGSLLWASTTCFYSCGSAWTEGGFDRTPPGQLLAKNWPERSCGAEEAEGVVLAAASTVEVLIQHDDLFALASLSPRSLAAQQQLVIGRHRDIMSAVSFGVQTAALLHEEGRVRSVPDGRTFTPAVAARDHFYYDVRNAWANPERLLIAQFAQPGRPEWESVRRDGSDSRIIARGEVGACGHPIVGNRAWALSDEDRSVVGLSLDQSAAPAVITGNPLYHAQCVAGEGDVLAVTGRSHGLPAVAIHEAGTWTVFEFPAAPSIAEPVVADGLVVVAIPEAPFVPSHGTPVLAAGAVFVLDKSDGQWAIRERIVAREPRTDGHFGFALAVNEDALFINYLVPGQVLDAEGYLDRYGYPRLCRAPRRQHLHEAHE